jgi:hypothetical protein
VVNTVCLGSVAFLQLTSVQSVESATSHILEGLLLLFNCNWVDTLWLQYTFTHKQYTEYRGWNTHKNYKEKNWGVNWEVRLVPRLCELYPGICVTAEEKAWKNLS